MKSGSKAIKKAQLLIINADDLDFEKNAEDLGKIIALVDSQIHGLF
jgi:hypothetical protein